MFNIRKEDSCYLLKIRKFPFFTNIIVLFPFFVKYWIFISVLWLFFGNFFIDTYDRFLSLLIFKNELINTVVDTIFFSTWSYYIAYLFFPVIIPLLIIICFLIFSALMFFKSYYLITINSDKIKIEDFNLFSEKSVIFSSSLLNLDELKIVVLEMISNKHKVIFNDYALSDRNDEHFKSGYVEFSSIENNQNLKIDFPFQFEELYKFCDLQWCFSKFTLSYPNEVVGVKSFDEVVNIPSHTLMSKLSKFIPVETDRQKLEYYIKNGHRENVFTPRLLGRLFLPLCLYIGIMVIVYYSTPSDFFYKMFLYTALFLILILLKNEIISKIHIFFEKRRTKKIKSFLFKSM